MARRSWWRFGGPPRKDIARETHWLHVPDRPPPPKVYVEEHPSVASPEGPSPLPPRVPKKPLRKRTYEAVAASLVLHIILLYAAGTMVPGVKPLFVPDSPEMQVTLVEPIQPIEIPPPPVLKLRELNEPDTAPPSTVPVLRTTPRPPALENPKELARPTQQRQIAPLITPTAPIIPAPQPTPAPAPTAPPTPLPKLVRAPPTKLEDLNLHNTPTPAPTLRPQLTLPAPPSFGSPGGTPGSAAPGGGTPGLAAPGGGASAAGGGQGVIGNGGGGCSKATLPLLSAAEQERCKVQAALAAAAALRNMKANDRNASPLDSLGDKRAGFAAERMARDERAASGAALLGAIQGNRGAGAVAKDNGIDASAGAKCTLKFGPTATDEKLKCGVGFVTNGAPPKR